MRHLRANLASCLRRAESGERIVVTVDGAAVAQLGPLAPRASSASLEELAAQGLVVLPRRKDVPEEVQSVPVWTGSRIDRLLREVRGS